MPSGVFDFSGSMVSVISVDLVPQILIVLGAGSAALALVRQGYYFWLYWFGNLSPWFLRASYFVSVVLLCDIVMAISCDTVTRGF